MAADLKRKTGTMVECILHHTWNREKVEEDREATVPWDTL